jgi:galactose mutarotase-like enzyme
MTPTNRRGFLQRSAFAIAAAPYSAASYEVFEKTSSDPSALPLVGLRDNANGVEALIAPGQGGELSSLRLLHRGQWVELLYRAADYSPVEGWRGKAPLLWPSTGRSVAQRKPGTPEEGYYLGERFHPMPIHGFVMGLPWKLEERGNPLSGAFATVSLTDSAATRKSYPFGFRLTTTFRVRAGKLEILYRVLAASGNTQPMFFSIGNHISFRMPFLPGGTAAAMKFFTPASIEIEKTKERLPNGKIRPWALKAPIQLDALPADEAVSLTGYAEREPYATLEDPGGLGIRISHRGDSVPAQPCVLFNVWKDKAGTCFCPEPWIGLQNSFNLKQGLVFLKPGAAFEWKIGIERLGA